MFGRSFLLLTMIACGLGTAHAGQKFNAFLTGAQLNPPNIFIFQYLIVEGDLRPSATVPGGWTLQLRSRNWNNGDASDVLSVYKNASYGQTGELVMAIPFAPASNWTVSLEISQQDVDLLRANRWYLQENNSGAHPERIRGQLKLANGTYNDADGDGRTDLQVYRTSNQTFYSLLSADQSLQAQFLGETGDSVSLTVDFDGDARSDYSTARYNAEVLWRIYPSLRRTPYTETRWGSSTLGDFLAAADYDGDARMDIAVFRAGVWHILQSSDGTYRQEYWGTSGDVPAATDFDNDSIADPTIARSESGQRVWYTRLSTTGAMRVTSWGLSSDAFFTGRTDFDGDGAADILVIRNESGQRVFYIRRSSDGAMQVIPWGLSSDVVKLGDYDGDGKTDPTVTRAVNGQRVFYILQSSNGQPRYDPFGLAGDF